MAQAELTQQSVIEAGIAASLASDPDLLPEPSIWFQDFTFGGTMFDAAFGNAEALGGVGEAISDVAIDNRLEFERKEREENDPAKDAGMIVELAENQRRESARYVNGNFHINGMMIAQADMDRAVDLTLEQLPEISAREGWTSEQEDTARDILTDYKAADGNPEQQAQILSRAEDVPNLTDYITANADPEAAMTVPTDLTVVEERAVAVEQLSSAPERLEATAETAALEGYETPEEAVAVADRVETVRAEVDIGDNPFADTRASSESFNPAAQGRENQPELAQAERNAPTNVQRFEI